MTAAGTPVLIADPEVLEIPIAECGEPLVDLREVDGVGVDPRDAERNPLWSHVREGVAERLVRASALLGGSARPVVVEGYRPPELQRRYFERRLRRVAARRPGWSRERLSREASRFVAPPDIAPPHVTGGAIDLVLVDAAGAELDLGTRVNESPEDCDERCVTDAPGLPAHVRANRDRLVAAMRAAGFANYPTEWWHWSYGDRYWALVSGAPAAIYGEAPAPGDRR
jgi:D-alanyl-D-alanine dipeptidase